MKDSTLRRFEELEARIAAVQQRVDEQATEKTRDREWLRSLSVVPSMVLGPGRMTGKAPDPADTAKVGDDLGMHWLDEQRDDFCAVSNSETTCCRRYGHRRQHLSTRDGVVLAVWPNVADADPLPDGGTHTCPRCLSYVEALPPRRICDECETEVGARSGECGEKYQLDGCRCTLSAGHDGHHEAGGLTRTWHRWPREEADGAAAAVGQRDQTAAIEGAATTLRAHRAATEKWEQHSCSCGWDGRDHARHVAEQLAAVGALGDREPSPVDTDTERRLRAGRISTFILTHRMHERDPRADACACGWTPASDVKRGEWRSAHLRHIFEQVEAAEVES